MPRSRMSPPLTTSMTFLRKDQTAFGVFLGNDEGIDLFAELDLFRGVDGLADRELGGGNYAFGLVADVEQHLVTIDADDGAGYDIALLERDHGGRVVGNDPVADFDQQAI